MTPSLPSFHATRVLRPLRWVLGGLLGVYVLYLVVANLVLTRAAFAMILRGTEDVQIEFDGAYSVWPGAVHLRGVKLLISDHNIQARIVFDRATADLDLVGLLKRQIHARNVHAEHVSVRVRSRVEPYEVTEPFVAALPPIPPFDDPPVTLAWVDEPCDPPGHSKKWTIHLEDVDATVYEAWIQQFRYLASDGEGEARARGSFKLRSGYTLEVGPATLDVAPGTLRMGEEILLSQLEGSVGVTVEPFFVDVPRRWEILRYFDADLHLHAHIDSAKALGPYLGQGTRAEDGSGQLDIDVSAKNGVLAEGSLAVAQTSRLFLEKDHFGLWAPFTMSVVARTTSTGQADLVVSAPHARAMDHGQEVGIATGIVVDVRSPSADLVPPIHLSHLDMSVGDALVPDVSKLAARARPAGVILAGGSARASVKVSRERDDLWHGDGTLRVEQLGLGTESAFFRVSASTAFSGTRDHDAFSGSVHANGDLAVEAAKLRVATDVSLALDARDLRLEKRTGSAHVDLRVRDGRLGREDAFTAGLAELSLVGDVDVPRQGSSTAEVVASVARLSLKRGDVETRARVNVAAKLSGDRLELSGPATASVREGRLSSGDRGVDAWWGDLRGGIRVRLDEPTVTARAQIHLRDAKPILAVLAADGDMPSWLSGSVGGSEVQAQATMQSGRGVLALAILNADDGKLDLRGRMVKRGDATKGAFLVRLEHLAALSAGVLLDGRRAHVAPLVGTGWLAGHGGETACARPLGC